MHDQAHLTNSMHAVKGRWWLLLAHVVIATATAAFQATIAVYLIPMEASRGWAPELTVLTFTAAYLVGAPAGIFGGALRDRFGDKRVILVCGVLFGAALAASAASPNVWFFIVLQGAVPAAMSVVIFIAQVSNIGRLFPERRGFAIGVMVSCSIVLSGLAIPAVQSLVANLGTVPTLAIQGVFFGALIVILGLVLKYPPAPSVDTTDHVGDVSTDLNWKRMLATPAFYLIFLVMALLSFGGMMISSNGISIGVALGSSPEHAAWILSMSTLCTGAGAALGGILLDRIGMLWLFRGMALAQLLAVIGGIAVGLNTEGTFLAMALILGFVNGAAVTALSASTLITFGPSHFGVNYGIMSLAVLVSATVAPQLAVRLDPTSAFAICGVLSFFALIAAALLSLGIRRLRTREAAQLSVEEDAVRAGAEHG